ncbi:hypothetical protein GCM10023191_030510 [Actinoallomurus oryzae]|uniref:Pectate lyase domain-containing protein n=1 Tax=Actinoallomurus oryzae TaxID=502180 RepID=A0ABP8PVL4_9ACTN
MNGTISLSSMTKVTSDKTIIGVGTAGRITGYVLNVNQANNVVIRNLTFTGSADDAINVQYSTHAWIDHNDLSNAYDGATDIKRASDYVTVSWNPQTGDSPEGNLRLADNYLTGSGTAESRNASRCRTCRTPTRRTRPRT